MVCSIYGLLQYLLLQDEEDARSNTFYFFDTTIPRSVAEKLLSTYPYGLMSKDKYNLNRFFRKVFVRLFKNIQYPFIKTSKIFAQDFLFAQILIGRKQYALIEECPYCIELNSQKDSAEDLRQKQYSSTLKGRINMALYGRNVYHIYGDNKQCTEFYLTEENQSHVLNGKKVYIQSLEEMWKKSTDTKRAFILDVFGVTREELEIFREYPIVYLSRPMVEDGIFTENEYVELLQRIFSHFPEKEILIKTHPRDSFDYNHYFPTIPVFRKNLNMQLLQLLDVRIKTAVGICTTALSTMPKDTEVILVGPSVHPKIEQFFGSNYSISREHKMLVP